MKSHRNRPVESCSMSLLDVNAPGPVSPLPVGGRRVQDLGEGEQAFAFFFCWRLVRTGRHAQGTESKEAGDLLKIWGDSYDQRELVPAT